MSPTFHHVPVLLTEVLEALRPQANGIYVDATFGGGGYSRAILEAAPGTMIWAIDRDPRALENGAAMAATFPGRLQVVEGRFGMLEQLLTAHGVTAVMGVVFDIGVSSPQLDEAERGFSFRADGPLDMRMSQHGPTAADAVNTLPEAELADIIFQLGEERMSRRVAKAIVAARAQAPLQRTLQLAEIVRGVVPGSRDGIDPATRTFQALRLWVNDELGELERGLAAAERVLSPGGRLVVVSFHSLEDRRVKDFLRKRSGAEAAPSRHAPVSTAPARAPSFTLLTRRPVTANVIELGRNPRARSAKLRAAERTTAPAFSYDEAAA